MPLDRFILNYFQDNVLIESIACEGGVPFPPLVHLQEWVKTEGQRRKAAERRRKKQEEFWKAKPGKVEIHEAVYSLKRMKLIVEEKPPVKPPESRFAPREETMSLEEVMRKRWSER